MNRTVVDASPEAVFAVLADPFLYGDWVVGSRETRWADPGWPAEHTRFHHTQGLGPLVIAKDFTEALETVAPRRLVMEVHARPLIVGRVEMSLAPAGGGTEVTMVESVIGGALKVVPSPVMDRAIKARNAESLRRLRRLAEAREQPAGSGQPARA